VTALQLDSLRFMPHTVPDEWVASHPFDCRCEPCLERPTDLRRRLKRQHRGATR
jgi:hypothetical protein